MTAFGGQKEEVMRYKEPLKESEKAGIAKANKVGLAMGLLYATMFCAYGLAFWFGARMIIEDDYTGPGFKA